MEFIIYAMVYLGAALMAYNVFCFARFIRFIRKTEIEGESDAILYIALTLLVLFLIGYLAVGLFGEPDLVMGGILFGGSIFVFVMYRLISSSSKRVMRSGQLEAELMAAAESSRVKTSFLSTISHEMRTPMNVILGLDGIALRNPNLDSDTRELLEKIGFSAQHLLDLINNILEINSLDSGELEAKQESFCLNVAWEHMNALASTLCAQKGLTYQTSIGESATGWYRGDQTLIKQVMFSILDNAVKYTEAPGTVTFSIEDITAGADSADDELHTIRFTISDTGVGISPENIERIFEPLEQEDASATRRYGGSGVGLAVAKGKVDLMGGSIAVESTKDEGSTFTVTIPLVPADDDAPAIGHELTLDETVEDVSLEGMRILVVEDIAENAEIVEDLLDLEGASCEHAENGQIALDMFESSPVGYYDAILMDLRMPIMAGLEATRRIRHLDRADAMIVPILALTANAFESDVKSSLDAGMNVHLAKPINADRLYAELKHLVAQARAKGAGESS